MSDVVGTLKIVTELDAKGAKEGAKDLSNSLTEAGEKSKGLGDLASAGFKVLATSAVAATTAVGGLMAAATKVGASFESSMSNVAATMGITADEIANGSEAYKILEDAARECGETTKYSASEAASGLNYLALAGFDAAKSAEVLPKVLNLAAAGGMELATASDMVTDSMAALGLETSQLDMYIDEMARTAQKSNTSVQQLGEATITVAGMISTTGQSLETMNAELGILANNGIKGAEGGTHLRNVLLSLSSPTDQAAKALKQMNINIYDSEGNMRDLNDILLDMNSAMSTMSQGDKTNIISTIFNKTDIAAVNALLKGTGAEFDNLITELNNASGAAADMADTMNQNLTGKITILKSGLEGLGITAYKIFEGSMKKAVDSATGAVNSLQKSMSGGKLEKSLSRLGEQFANLAEKGADLAVDVLPKLIDGVSWIIDHGNLVVTLISSIVAAQSAFKLGEIVMTAVGAFTSLTTATEGATVAQLALNAAMDVNPIILAVSAVAALTAGLIAYAATTESAAEAQQRALQEMTEEYDRAAEETREMVDSSNELQASLAEDREYVTQLCDELERLNATDIPDADYVNSANAKRAKEIVQELNTRYENLNLTIDEQTGRLAANSEGWRANIEEQLRSAEVEAISNKLSEAYARQAENSEKLWKANKDIADIHKQRADINRELLYLQEKGEAATGAETERMAELYRETERLSEEEEALANSKKELLEADKELNSETEEYKQYMEEELGITEDVTQSTEEMADAAEDAANAVDGLGNAAQEASEELRGSLAESIIEQLGLFDEWDAKIDESGKKLIQNMESQVAGLQNWADNMKKLGEEGVEQGFLLSLADMGTEGAGYVQALVTSLEKGEIDIDNINNAYRERTEALARIPGEVADSIYAEAEKIPSAYAEGVINSAAWDQMDSATRAKISELANVANDAVAPMQEAGENLSSEYAEKVMNSPAWTQMSEQMRAKIKEAAAGTQTEAEEGAKNIGKAYENAKEANIEAATEATKATTDAVKETIDTETSDGSIEDTVEANVGGGITDGINSGTGQATTAATAMCNKVINTIKTSLRKGVFVPVGVAITEGIMQGLEQGSSALMTMIEQMCAEAVTTAQKSLEINSPSHIFRDKVGASIPEGTAVGVEQKAPLLNEAIVSQMMAAVSEAQGAVSRAMQGSRMSEAVINNITNADNINDASNQELKAETNVTVVLEGDAAELFRVVKEQNDIRTLATGRNALAYT